MIGDGALVLLAAGPFAETSATVLRAALDAGVHYLDVANELPVVDAALAADAEARRQGVTVLPAVGFGTVASDGLARYVADQVPGASKLELAVLLGTDGSSSAARASTMRVLAGGGRVVRDGQLVRQRLGAGARRQRTPRGDRTLVPVPTGDLVVTRHTTGISDITVSYPVSMPPIAAKLAMPALPLLARAASRLPQRATQPSSTDAGTLESHVWARAAADDGRTAEAWVRTGEGYAYTARSAVLAVEATLRSESLGATTVARAFGHELSFEAGGELVA
jgi:short subunit dehydrogenase-like uncharacterized protein